MGESSQMVDVQRLKRQNCGSLVQGHQNSMNGIHRIQDQAGLGSRTNMEIEESIGQCPGPVFIGNANMETVSNNDGLMVEDRVGIWNPVLASYSAQSTDSTMTSYCNTDGQGPLGGSVGEYNGGSQSSSLRDTNYLEPNVLGRRRGLDPNMFTYLIPLSEGGTGQFPVEGSIRNNSSNLYAHTRGGWNKRKIPVAGMAGSLPLRASHSFGRQESNDARSFDGSGPSRSDMGNLMSANSATSAHMNPVWDASRDIARGNSALPYPRGNSASNRYPSCIQQEQSQAQLHLSFMQNSMATMPSQPFLSRRIMTTEQVESTANTFNSVLPVVENRSAFPACNPSSSSSVAGTWCGNSMYPAVQTYHSTFVGPTRQISPGIFERNQISDLSNGASSRLGIADAHSCFPNQITFDSAGLAMPARTSRALGTRESQSHVPYMGAHPFVYPGPCAYPGSVASRSSAHISIMPSSRRNTFTYQGHLIPGGASSASNNMIPAPQMIHADPSSMLVHGPCPQGTPLFLAGRGESGQASSMPNLLCMPYQELQILPAGGGNRQRFLSDELLDRSLVYNGLDVPDQHSGMRLDVDNMSYEELLALEERIGNVNTGLSDDIIAKCLKQSTYASSNITAAAVSQESEIKCSICQEEYLEEDGLGKLDCGHSYHTTCIKQWLMQKNQCPICKAAAYSESKNE